METEDHAQAQALSYPWVARKVEPKGEWEAPGHAMGVLEAEVVTT